MSYFHNKRIWVTGASSGIGRSVAIKLSKLGAEVILTARNRDKLEEVKKECGNATVSYTHLTLPTILLV